MNLKIAAGFRGFRPAAAFILALLLLAGAGCASQAAPEPTAEQPAPAATATFAVEDLPPAPTPFLTPAAEESVPATPTAQIERAVSLPDPSSAVWREIASGLERPVDLAALPDGSGRLLIAEQTGRIRVVLDGVVQPEPFLDISGRAGRAGNEQGLLGLALHPDYLNNGFFYVNYTDQSGNTVISRFKRSEDPNRADPNSEQVLLRVNQPFPNHNGGAVRFGPDGFLYLGLGDGGSQGDPQGNAQNPASLLGKILRIDVNRESGYGIPEGNLYPGGEGFPEVFASGLRNPWRIAFDPFNGDLYIADVGQSQWEEIDLLPAGSNLSRNFGWNYLEGRHAYQGQAPAGIEFVPPLWEYDHSQGCSVTGGEVYAGSALPQWRGVYLFADFCNGRLWGLVLTPQGVQTSTLYETGASVSSFGVDADGEVYLLDLKGRILRLEPSGG